MPPYSVVRWTCWRRGMPSRGTLTGLRGGPVRTSWSSARPRARSCTCVRAIPSTNTGWVKNGWRAAVWRTWVCWLIRSSIWPSNVCSQPRRPTISWAASTEVWPAGWRRGFWPSAPLSWDPTWSPVSSSGALSTGKAWSCWSKSRKEPQKWSEGWSTSPMRTGCESWGCSAWRREGCGETL